MNFKNIVTKLSVLTMALTVTSAVWADDGGGTPSENASAPVSTTSIKPEADAAKFQRVDITYFGIYLGPSLTTPGSSAQISPTTSQPDATNWPQVLESQIKLNYNFNDTTFIGPVINFYNFPGQTNTSMIQDSGVRVGTKSLYKNGAFNVSADLRFLAPLTPSDIAASANILYESVLNLKYEIPQSKWTLGVLNFLKYHTYANNGITKPDADFYVAPNTNWQFSKKVAATLYVEFYPEHKIGDEGWVMSQPMDLNPGINWDITDNFGVNPGVVFYPTNPTWAATSAIVYISGKLL